MIEDYAVIDLEMTGLNAKTDEIIEVGAVRIRGGKAAGTFGMLLKPKKPIPPKVTELTGITDAMAEAGREPEEAMQEFFDFVGDDILVGQNVIFDYSFLKQWAVNHNFPFERMAVDTLKLARKFLPGEEKKNLESLCSYFGIPRQNAHRALDDALETWQIFEEEKRRYGTENEEAFLPKPLRYQAKKQEPATARQKKYLCRYAGYFGIELPPEFEYLTRSEASRQIDKWIQLYGRMSDGEH